MVQQIAAARMASSLDFSNISNFGWVIASLGGRFPLLEAITPARSNPIVGGSRHASPAAVHFAEYVSIGSRAGIRRSGVIGVRRHGSATQAELNARCR
jgi:hypothetical protein